MRWHDAAVVAATAAATALAVLAVSWTGLAVATEGQPPEVQWPVLRVEGCEITLQTDQAAYKAGDAPMVKLVAANPGQRKRRSARFRIMKPPPSLHHRKGDTKNQQGIGKSATIPLN